MHYSPCAPHCSTQARKAPTASSRAQLSVFTHSSAAAVSFHPLFSSGCHFPPALQQRLSVSPTFQQRHEAGRIDSLEEALLLAAPAQQLHHTRPALRGSCEGEAYA